MKVTFSLTFVMYVIAVITRSWCSATNITAQYSWLENNDKYDCIVGISVDGKPVSMGMILSENLIITSANPIERVNDFRRIKIHTINGAFNRQTERSVFTVTKDQAKRITGGHWKTFGFDKRHAPHHDMVLISPRQNIKLYKGPRSPIQCTFASAKFVSSGRFSYVGFGFIDKPHVRLNVELELAEYGFEEVYTDCSEWIPLIWGNFICLLNVEHFVGVSSGGGLFYNDYLVGVGCFGVKKGDEGILLFTDIRKYPRSMQYYYLPEQFQKPDT
ncbi:uncharacterized protein LOC113495077 [Trichoplusia ni]|uniref:Uncharacterized protein LOC113495077 n=1 Tax=Trichoplusia ni TaxID=7111 RepID=A0A7E5VMC0_TRINI|nr:uncharacterized protein LOC113495077 [Trichoplusia ni]